MHKIAEINPVSVKPWLSISLALFCFCPIFSLFTLLCLSFSLFFLLPILALILALEFFFLEPLRFVDAILGTKLYGRSIDHDDGEERSDIKGGQAEGQERHLREKQVSLDLDSMELPCLYESTTDDDDENTKERSTVGEQPQRIKRDDCEPWV